MYCGGPGSDAVSSVHIDGSGLITVGGSSALPGLAALTEPILSPSAAPAGGAYVGRFSPDLTRSLYGALFGGITGFKGTGIQGAALLPRGAVATAGLTTTKDFPTSPGAIQPAAPGGQNDGFVAVHRMLPVGVFAVGRSGPEANRAAYLGATGPAQAGNGSFALYASSLPPSTHGVLAIGRPAHNAFPLGDALLHVHPRGLALVPWFTGPRGYAVRDLPLPSALAGQELAAQILLASPSGDLSWTHGLHLSIAP